MRRVTGDELSKLRGRLGLTQTALAAQLGVHPITISKWETGVHAVPEPVAKLLRLMASAAPRSKRRN